ncbi:MAG: hypothetical protein GY940_41280, partial [bacterium]|nr:hypothetical protein [bacterium]
MFPGKPGQPVWLILEPAEKLSFIETLLGLLPINDRKQLSFSTDFYNSFNIQHYFRLATANTQQETPYQNCKLYDFAQQVFPEPPARENTYLQTIPGLSPEAIQALVNDLDQLQVNFQHSNALPRCRELLHKYTQKENPYRPVLYEVTPLEVATVLLGVKHPEAEPDYQAFRDFYKHFIAKLEPGWFEQLYEPSLAPPELFIALFKLLESRPGIAFKKKVFDFVYRHLETAGSAALLNRLTGQFPDGSQDMMDYFQSEFNRLFT